MNIVVDTSVWSLVLRRNSVNKHDPHVRAFRACVEADYGLFLLGPILQELLDGLRSEQQFTRLLTALRPFPLVPLDRQTYVLAAHLRNDFRGKGIQAGPADFLIAAACIESGYPLLTADHDFQRIAADTDLILLPCEDL
ncbi:MAG: type II toxin-antitoxin system VapC family toxin [Phycisphaerales bacterium]